MIINIIAIDSPKKFNDFNDYLNTLEELFLGFKKQIKNIYIKFHPAFTHFTAEKQLVNDYFMQVSN